MQLASKLQSSKIQILRGMAIIAVVFIHNTPQGISQVVLRPFMNFSVALFLFISGLMSKRENYNPRKRIMKVLIPYVIWTFLYVIYDCIIHNSASTPTEVALMFLKRLVLADSAAMMYYVFVYIQFTLLIPLIDKVAKSRIYIPFIVAPLEIVSLRLLPMLLDIDLFPWLENLTRVWCLPWFTFFYLGYLLGNRLIEIKLSTSKLVGLLIASTVLQMLEGYGYFILGDWRYGTQLKLSALLTSTVVLLLSYRFINNEREFSCKILKILGDNSFGIYFSHIAVMNVLIQIPNYTRFIVFPLNAVAAIIISTLCCIIGKRILGKWSKYLAL